jgi:yeast amino acid transporter
MGFETGAYGEAEFFFASIKVITITGLIVSNFLSTYVYFCEYIHPQILGVLLDLGAGPNKTPILFHNWKQPFVQFNGIPGSLGQFLGWWSVVVSF